MNSIIGKREESEKIIELEKSEETENNHWVNRITGKIRRSEESDESHNRKKRRIGENNRKNCMIGKAENHVELGQSK